MQIFFDNDDNVTIYIKIAMHEQIYRKKVIDLQCHATLLN